MTPRFCRALPQRTGTSLRDWQALAQASLTSFVVKLPSSQRERKVSSASARRSNRLSCKDWACSGISEDGDDKREQTPVSWGASCVLSLAPRGRVRRAGVMPRRDASSPKTSVNLPSRRSHLLIKMRLGRPRSLRCRQTASVWASTPSTAETMTMAASTALRLRSTSPEKSTCPGVSTRLRRKPCQKQEMAEAVMLMPRFCSSGRKSMTVEPASTSPMTEIAWQ